jgi:hypothetical protein
MDPKNLLKNGKSATNGDASTAALIGTGAVPSSKLGNGHAANHDHGASAIAR